MKSILDTTTWTYNPRWSISGTLESPIWGDERLSAKAKGIWAYMKSKPYGWDFCASRMMAEFKDGRNAILGAMKELEACGYMKKTKLGSGRVSYYLADNPWIGVEPEIKRSPLAKYAVLIDEPSADIGCSTKDAVGAIVLAYGAYGVDYNAARAVVGSLVFDSYKAILAWMDESKDIIADSLGLETCTEF